MAKVFNAKDVQAVTATLTAGGGTGAVIYPSRFAELTIIPVLAGEGIEDFTAETTEVFAAPGREAQTSTRAVFYGVTVDHKPVAGKDAKLPEGWEG